MSRFTGIRWFCDKCNALLNIQPKFDDYKPKWKCTECGYVNELSEDNIVGESDERMSARFVAERFGNTAKWVYSVWEDMGLVAIDKYGDWALTDAGRNMGGRMSKGNYPVPTFKYNEIAKEMRAHLA